MEAWLRQIAALRTILKEKMSLEVVRGSKSPVKHETEMFLQ